MISRGVASYMDKGLLSTHDEFTSEPTTQLVIMSALHFLWRVERAVTPLVGDAILTSCCHVSGSLNKRICGKNGARLLCSVMKFCGFIHLA